MKTLERKFTDSSICIYSFKNGVLTGVFFKEKPEINDVIIFDCRKYKVIEIIENIDAKVQSNCSHNPKMAYFKMKVRMM